MGLSSINIQCHLKKLCKVFYTLVLFCISLYPAFQCHENGATVLQYAPKQQLIITGGRKGFVCIFDIRQRQLLNTFQAHDSAIKALAMDSTEDFFVTGSAEGNMKVYSPKMTQCILNISCCWYVDV